MNIFEHWEKQFQEAMLPSHMLQGHFKMQSETKCSPIERLLASRIDLVLGLLLCATVALYFQFDLMGNGACRVIALLGLWLVVFHIGKSHIYKPSANEYAGAAMLGLGLSFMSLLLLLTIQGTIINLRQWDQFKSEHQCKIVSKVSGSLSTAVGPMAGSNGQMGIAVMPVIDDDKTGYLCDDGITYWR